MTRRSIVFPGAESDLVLQSSHAWADVLVLESHQALRDHRGTLCPGSHVLLLHLAECRVGLRVNGRTTWKEADRGSISVLGDGVRLEWETGASGPLLAAAIRPMFVASVAGQDGKGLGPLRSDAGILDAGIAHVLRALGAELAQDCPAGLVYWTSLATALAVQLLSQHVVDPPEAALHSGGLTPTRLQRVLDHIDANLHDDLSVSDLARIAELSGSHFAAAFRKSTGMPPYRYIMHRRAFRGKELLADPLRPIADIAYALGYSSQAHFTTTFRRMTGMSPGAYRSSILAGAGSVSTKSLNDHGPL